MTSASWERGRVADFRIVEYYEIEVLLFRYGRTTYVA